MNKGQGQEKSRLINDLHDQPSVIWTERYSYLVLFFICWLTFGSYWVYDTPGAIQTQLTKWFLPQNYTNTMNTSLYSAYSYPNILLAFFGGFIVDKVTGVRLGAAIFCALIFLGQTVFALGITFKLYWLAVIGRFVFGLGGESLTVAQNTLTARWFDGDKLAFAFGTVVSFSRIGTSVNFLITPYFAELGVPFSVWFGTEMCLMSFCAVGYVALLDWYGEAAVQRRRERVGMDEEPEVSLKQVVYFPLQSWIIFFNCLFFYISVLTFYTVASLILQFAGKTRYDSPVATNFLSIPNFVSIIASPLFGFILDKTGRSLIWMAVAGIMQVFAHLAMLAWALDWFTIHPIAIMVWIGFGYSMYAASIWPTLPFIIKNEMLGTAYGTMTSIQNLGLAVFPQIIGAIMDHFPNKNADYPDLPPEFDKLKWVIPIIIFIACAGVSVGLTFLLLVVDRTRTGGVLNAVGTVKQAHKAKLNSNDDPHKM